MNPTIGRTRVAWAVAFMVMLAAGTAFGGAAPSVGEVSLTIGVNRVVREGGNHTVQRGMQIIAGDRIETDRGGHVHLRFVDGAYVSVRPGSRLTIEAYEYDPANPKEGAVRFRLDSGVARTISGKIAESARERFRLNTPIAAIGVRGTDFVVLAERERVRAAVHSGAIVLAPLGNGCAVNALGPCATAAARTLSADMGSVMLEFQPQQGTPRVVPINGLPSPDRINPPTPQEPRASVGGSEAASETTTEVLAAQAVSGQLTPILPPATMVWGRWAAQSLPGDTISIPLAEASAGRQVTVGNDFYALFRPHQSPIELPQSLGKVEFTLRDAQAHLLRGGAAELARVDGASLSVDFVTRQFATSVAMSHPQAGSATLQASGNIRADGIFFMRRPDAALAGALTMDGKEAGYFFERSAPAGRFMGITRWAR